MPRRTSPNSSSTAFPPEQSTPLSTSRKLAKRIAAKEQEVRALRSGTAIRAKLQAELDLLRAEAAAQPFERIFCNECGGEREHEVRRTYKKLIRREDPGRYFPAGDRSFVATFLEGLNADERHTFTVHFEILECRACGSVVARRTEYLSVLETWYEDILRDPEVDESFGDKTFESLFVVTRYPPQMARRAPAWMTPLSASRSRIPKQVAELLEEIYQALQNGSRRLVAMGIRTALDQIMRDKVGHHRNFPEYLTAFQAADYISQRQKNILQTIIKAGNKSAHEGWQPSHSDITALLHITENVIETIYLHEPRAKQLQKKVFPKEGRRRPSRDPDKTYH